MRITQQLVANYVRQGLDRANRSVMDAAKQLQSGTSVETPSDDPVKAARIRQLQGADRDFARFEHNRNTVKSDLDSAEGVLGDIHSLVQQAHDIALAMAGDSPGPGIRGNAAVTVGALVDQMTDLINREQISGKHLFTGTGEDKPALDAAGAYQGNEASRSVEVGPGAHIEGTLRGSEVLGPNNELLASMRSLLTALTNDDGAATRATLDSLESARQTVSLARTTVGARLARLSDVADSSLSLQTQLATEQSELTAVDVAKVAPALSGAQTMLQAVIATSRQILDQVGTGWLK